MISSVEKSQRATLKQDLENTQIDLLTLPRHLLLSILEYAISHQQLIQPLKMREVSQVFNTWMSYALRNIWERQLLSAPDWYASRAALTEKMSHMALQYKNLFLSFGFKHFIKEHTPLTIADFQCYQQRRLNRSLLNLWKTVRLSEPQLPQFTKASAIRAWLENENNRAKLHPIKRLSLSKAGLYVLPPEVKHFTEVTILHLKGNRLTYLPPEIGELTKLCFLDASDNQITHLPETIGKLKLTVVNFANNHLSQLPETMKNLPCSILDLSNNQLITTPSWIQTHPYLKSIDLTGNPLESIPVEQPTLGTTSEKKDSQDPGNVPHVEQMEPKTQLTQVTLSSYVPITKDSVIQRPFLSYFHFPSTIRLQASLAVMLFLFCTTFLGLYVNGDSSQKCTV
jgi:hypothetical protein